MLAEALKAIENLSVAASQPKLLKEFATRASYLVNGSEFSVDFDGQPRKHKPGTLEEVVSLANRFRGEEDSPVVWYDGSAVVLVIDDADHRVETATLTLETSDLFAILVDLRRNPTKAWKDPKDFVRLIRVDLAGGFRDDLLLNAVRKIKFEGGNVTTAESARGKESLGREIHAKVEQAVPEEIVLEVPVWKTAGLTDKFPVRCTVEVDPMQCKLQLLPFPDEIERVLDMAVAMVGSGLENGLDKEIPRYQGKP